MAEAEAANQKQYDRGRFRRLLEQVPLAAALFVIVVAAMTLLGWLFEIEALVRVVPVAGAGAMMPSTGIGLLLCGAALGALRTQSLASQPEGSAGKVLAAVAALLGLLVLTEYIAGIDLGLDHLLFP